MSKATKRLARRAVDARLVELGEVEHAADMAERRGWRKLDALEEELRQAGKLSEAPWVKFAGHICHMPETILSLCRPQKRNGTFSYREGKEAIAELQAKTEAYQRRRRELGLAEIERRRDRYKRDWQAARSAIARTRAQSMIGVGVKLRAIRFDIRDGAVSFSDRILRSALKDAERLARRVRP